MCNVWKRKKKTADKYFWHEQDFNKIQKFLNTKKILILPTHHHLHTLCSHWPKPIWPIEINQHSYNCFFLYFLFDCEWTEWFLIGSKYGWYGYRWWRHTVTWWARRLVERTRSIKLKLKDVNLEKNQFLQIFWKLKSKLIWEHRATHAAVRIWPIR